MRKKISQKEELKEEVTMEMVGIIDKYKENESNEKNVQEMNNLFIEHHQCMSLSEGIWYVCLLYLHYFICFNCYL